MAYYQSKPTSGRHFLQIPGPTNMPDRVLRAMDNPTMDHRGPDFGKFGKQLLEKLRARLQDRASRWSIYPGLRHRRLGSGAGQYPLARRPRADVRDRLVRASLAGDGRAARPASPS